MKCIKFLIMLLVITGTCFGQATNWNVNGRPTSDWFSSADTPRNIPLMWMRAVDPLIGASGATGGDITYKYVDSNVSVEGDGSSWSNAKDTLNEAINLCTDSSLRYVIRVAAGHNESVGTSADQVDLDVAGITVIGYGNGDDRPTFDFDSDVAGSFAIGAAGVTLMNLNFLPSVTDVNEAIEIETAGDYATIYNCWFMDGETSADDEFIDAIAVASGADYLTVMNCRFDSYVAGATNGIDLTAGVQTGTRIICNEFNGDYSGAPIYSDDIDLWVRVEGNVCKNTNAGEFGIEFSAAATGTCVANVIYTNAVATALDPGSLGCFENYCINTVDLSASRVPALAAIGTVTAGSADDILKKMYYTSDGTGAYPATVANDSALAMVLSKSNPAAASSYDNTTDSLEAIRDSITALGISGVGTYADEVVTHMDANSILADLAGISEIGDKIVADMDANSTLVTILADTGAMDSEAEWADLSSTVVDNIVAAMDANSTLAAVATDTAAMDTAAEMAALADANSILYDSPRIISDTTSAMTLGNGYGAAADPTIFTVTGDILARCFAIVDTSCTSTSNDTLELGVTGDTACLLVQDIVDGVAFQQNDCWTLTQPPDTPSAEWDGEWVIIPNGLDIILTIDDNDMTAGVITFYLQWIPLSADAAVVGAAP